MLSDVYNDGEVLVVVCNDEDGIFRKNLICQSEGHLGIIDGQQYFNIIIKGKNDEDLHYSYCPGSMFRHATTEERFLYLINGSEALIE